MRPKYTALPARTSGLLGTDTSSSAMRPPFRTTRDNSAKNAGSSTKLRNAKPQVTPSTDPGLTGKTNASACVRGARLVSAASIP